MSILLLVLACFVVAMVILWCIVQAHRGEDGDDPGSGGGGPGGLCRPPKPPPNPPVCWAELERQFAEHAEAHRALDGDASRAAGSPR